jgi:CDP-6-deoxy-D-xylo-4-hexulose-3-dehydrase
MWKLMENIIDKDDVQQLIDFLGRTDRFTNGPKVLEFEKAWSQWLKINHSVMVNSGASGNFLSIALVKELFGLGEVIVPSLGWSSDVSSIVQLGMTPVFVDIDPHTLGISPKSLRMAMSADTKAVVIVHALGFNAVTPEIKNILDESGVFVIEDCCESHGALLDTKKQNKIGTYGDLSIFSFYYGHHMTTIEGGVVCMNDMNLYQLSKMLRSHGMTRESTIEIAEEYKKNYPSLNPLFTFALAGFNFRSTEINAVLGLSQIKKIEANIEARKSNLITWLNCLDSSKFKVDYFCDGNSNFALPLILKDPDCILMKKVCFKLDELGVEYRLGTAGGGNLSRQPFVQKYSHRVVDDQSVVDHLHHYGLYVGNGSHVVEKNIQDLTAQLNLL